MDYVSEGSRKSSAKCVFTPKEANLTKYML